MDIHLFEDGVAELEPLTLTRPAFALRCGAVTLLERQLRYFGATRATATLPPGRDDACRITTPEVTPEAAPAGAVLVNARWLPPAVRGFVADGPAAYLAGGEVAFAVLPADTVDRSPEQWRAALPVREAGGVVIRYPWDLVGRNAEALEQDWRHWSAERDSAPVPPGVTLLGPPDRLRLDPAARVEPNAVLDTTRGPVLVDRGAVVQAFSRVEGPCHVGPGTQVLGARVRGSSFGPECRVGGEVECSILQGYANKAHDGFLGHSYLGEWVNLGAGTHTSDLRVDYGPVKMTAAGRPVETGLLKVGSFLGDHAKTSVGTLFNTGTAVGPFAQLVTSGALMPRSVPAFCRHANGRLAERTDLGDMFATAATVLARRGRAWTEEHAEFFFDLYERTAEPRRRALREAEQRRLRRVV